MKLQKLTIHNIASIKDATIDFEAQPLSGSEVFLITGETGSGKTTILDAICLALFADTPRLEGTQMQGKTLDGNKEITLYDPRQLLRRDAVEAFVSLSFTGNDNKHYLAEWSVERAYKKIEGNLKARVWKLTNLDTSHTYDKEDQIKRHRGQAVGLDFDQFCRTTMLAQGEFTRFLDSNDDKKAEILEKITGTDTYAKVGKKIYDITKTKGDAKSVVEQALSGMTSLDEKQLKDKNGELANLNTKLGNIQKVYDADKAKLDWMNNEKSKSTAVSDTVQKHNDAKAEVEKDTFKTKDLLVKQWNETIEARGWMVAKEKAEETKKTQLNALDNLANKYTTILGGYQSAMQEKQRIEGEIQTIDTYLEAEKGKEKVYENAQRIVGKLEIIGKGRNLIAIEQDKIKEYDNVLKEYEPKLEGAKKNMETCKAVLDAQKDTIDNFAKMMRVKLHVGDKCPVCGQTIASELPHEEELEALVKRYDEEYNGAKGEYDVIDGKIRAASNSKQASEELVKSKKNEVVDAEMAVESDITGAWPIDWKEKPQEFAVELNRKAETFHKNVKQKQELNNRLGGLTNDSQQVESVIRDLQQMRPAWRDLQPKEVKELFNLLGYANEVKIKTSTACVLLERAEKDITDNSQPLDAFLTEHSEITPERLVVLIRYTAQEIANIHSALKKSKDDVLTTKTLMENAAKDYEKHLENKPELTENDTEEALTTRLAENEQKKSEFNQQIGSIKTELENDNENKKKIGEKEKELAELDADFQKWSRLNDLLGDATGNKFRKIAQSYVLGSLIHTANSYMKTLTDRYTLKVKPGTFVISIEDAYQGFASRAASTISGGESFLVSLALALALSDIGEKLKVDTLFIDEGFGTLSGEPLQNAINTLRSLHSSMGRQVGIISHVKELREKIPVKIMVDREGHSSFSTVKVVPEV